MNDNNKLEIIRVGRSEEIDLLSPIEQGLIYGGENIVICKKGYEEGDGIEGVSCKCGYKAKEESSAPD